MTAMLALLFPYGLLLAMLVVMIWTNRMAYRQGIWDGAFNHFLPHVRREMLYYDRHRAVVILKNEGIEI